MPEYSKTTLRNSGEKYIDSTLLFKFKIIVPLRKTLNEIKGKAKRIFKKRS